MRISSAPIWPASFCRWVGRVPGDTRIIRLAGSTIRKTKEVLPREENAQKAEAAQIFYARYVEARENAAYHELKAAASGTVSVTRLDSA